MNILARYQQTFMACYPQHRIEFAQAKPGFNWVIINGDKGETPLSHDQMLEAIDNFCTSRTLEFDDGASITWAKVQKKYRKAREAKRIIVKTGKLPKEFIRRKRRDAPTKAEIKLRTRIQDYVRTVDGRGNNWVEGSFHKPGSLQWG